MNLDENLWTMSFGFISICDEEESACKDNMLIHIAVIDIVQLASPCDELFVCFAECNHWFQSKEAEGQLIESLQSKPQNVTGREFEVQTFSRLYSELMILQKKCFIIDPPFCTQDPLFLI